MSQKKPNDKPFPKYVFLICLLVLIGLTLLWRPILTLAQATLQQLGNPIYMPFVFSGEDDPSTVFKRPPKNKTPTPTPTLTPPTQPPPTGGG